MMNSADRKQKEAKTAPLSDQLVQQRVRDPAKRDSKAHVMPMK